MKYLLFFLMFSLYGQNIDKNTLDSLTIKKYDDFFKRKANEQRTESGHYIYWSLYHNIYGDREIIEGKEIYDLDSLYFGKDEKNIGLAYNFLANKYGKPIRTLISPDFRNMGFDIHGNEYHFFCEYYFNETYLLSVMFTFEKQKNEQLIFKKEKFLKQVFNKTKFDLIPRLEKVDYEVGLIEKSLNKSKKLSDRIRLKKILKEKKRFVKEYPKYKNKGNRN